MTDNFVLVETDPSTGMTIAVLRTYEASRRAEEDLDLLQTMLPGRHFKVVCVPYLD